MGRTMPTHKAFATLLLASLVWTSRAQAPGPAFDVASVKVAETATVGSPLKRSGGRISWIAGRLNFVSYAFRVPIERISGLTSDGVRWAVEANTDAEGTDDRIRLMLQRLLAERFQLSVHRETKDQQVFALPVAKGGPKMRVVKPDDEVSPPPPGVLRGIKPSEGHVIGFGRKSHAAMIGRRVTMQALMGPVESVVLDRTGLTGTFDLDLNYAFDTASNPDWTR